MMTSEFSLETDKAPVVHTLNQAPESVLLVNASGVIELANEAALVLFGAAEHTLCGARLASLFDTRGGVRLDLALARVLADEPGNRLEDVRANLSGDVARGFKLTLARMRHRDGVCVVVAEDEAAEPPSPRMPRVSDPFFGGEPEKSVPPREPKRVDPPGQPNGFAAPKGQLPWQNRARRAAMAERQAAPTHYETAQIISRPVAAKPLPQENHTTGFDQAYVAKPERYDAGNRADSANSDAPKISPAEIPNRVSWDPASRDIYAEFESARDQKERQADLPLISPAKCLVSAIERYREEAVAESLRLVSDIDEDERPARIDEDLLTRMFEVLVERMITVSPPYCEARISFQLLGDTGFHATFVDIGRGLGEQELEALLEQPELALGISHTGLVEASRAASALGLGFSVSSAITGGTTVEVTYSG